MNYVRLGRTGLKVSEYCMGGDNFGGQMDEAESLARDELPPSMVA